MTKTKTSRRTIALDDRTIDALKKHKEMIEDEKLKAKEEGSPYKDNDLVVCTSIGTIVNPRNLLRTYYRLRDLSKVSKISFHSLRHTHATLMLKHGTRHIKIVSERLRHANVKITLETYAHVIPGMQEEATEKFSETLFESQKADNDSL